MINCLFRRLFLGLWLIITITACAAYSVSSYLQYKEGCQGALEWRLEVRRSLDTVFNIAIFEGKDALIKWLLSRDNAFPTIYVQKLDGLPTTDISGRQIPEVALNRLAEWQQMRMRSHHARHSVRNVVIEGVKYRIFATRTEALPFDIRPLLPPGFPILKAIVISLFLTFAISWILARHYSHPIKQLTSAMQDFAQGDFNVRIAKSIKTYDKEISNLAIVFDKMASQIEGFISRQQTLFHDVSHEVRSPLTRMELAIAIAKKDESRVNECLNRIEKEIVKVDSLMTSLLTYARLNEIDQIEKTPTNLNKFILDITDEIEFEAKEKGIKVVCNFYELDKVVQISSSQISGAIQNIARNAIRYTPAGGLIIITSFTRNNEFFWICKDSGPGIDKNELSNIFQPFVRGANERTGTGFGLGLAIAKKAIELHSGTIAATNSEPCGLEVTICIPF